MLVFWFSITEALEGSIALSKSLIELNLSSTYNTFSKFNYILTFSIKLTYHDLRIRLAWCEWMVWIFGWWGTLISIRDLRLGTFETILSLLYGSGNFFNLNLCLNHHTCRIRKLILIVNIFPAYKLVLHRLVPLCSLHIGDCGLVPSTTWHRLVGELRILVKEVLGRAYNFGISIC